MIERSVGGWGAALAGLLLASTLGALEVPELTGRVNDHAGLLNAEVVAWLETKLSLLEEETGAQAVVLTIDSLEGEVLEVYSLRVAESWQLGAADVDNGVLFLIVENDRKLRLEVGYGLEERLTDLTSKRILDEMVVPHFRAGDYAAGIGAGVDGVAYVVRGGSPLLVRSAVIDSPPEKIVPPERVSQVRPEVEQRAQYVGGHRRPDWAIFFYGLSLLLFLSPFAFVALFLGGFGGWFCYLMLLPFLVFAGVMLFQGSAAPPGWGLVVPLTWLLGFPSFRIWLSRSAGGKRLLARHPKLMAFVTSSSGGGSYKSSWGSSSSSSFSSSSSSSSFSGGGGSFGGGGASSSW